MENLSKEREMLRQAESRLSREKQAMLAEQRNQNLLLTNLKTIQVQDHVQHMNEGWSLSELRLGLKEFKCCPDIF